MRRIASAALMIVLFAPAAASAHVSGVTAALQVALRATGDYGGTIDGVRGPGTSGAVRRFQARHHLTADGVAGAATRRALGGRGRPAWGHRTMTYGAHGWDVARMEFQLARHGFPNGAVDGGFGPHALNALKRFQAFAGLSADGVAGPATLRALGKAPPQSPLKFYRPLGVAVGDRFGPRGNMFHPGLDFPAPVGTAVGAAGRGCVSFVGYDPGGYGNLVIITHRLGVVTMYAHLSSFSVSKGQCVTGHDRIGRVGSTGLSTGPHLHFEVRLRGAAVDPLRAFL